MPVDVDTTKLKDVKLNVDANTGKATADVDKFVAETNAKSGTVKIKTDIDKTTIANEFSKIIADLNKGTAAKIKLELDQANMRSAVERAAADAAKVFGFKTVHLNVDVDKTHANAAFSSFRSLVGQTMAGIGGEITDSLSSAFTKASSVVNGFANALESGLSTALPVVGKLAVGIGTIAAGGVLLAEAGAGITAAWGAVSTAIAAVPAVIGLLGAPIAAVMIGMDGIKKAAQTLKPEFDKLKASVSATFEKGLTAVFTQLKGQMDALTPAVNAVATSMIGLAQQTANWITKAGGAKLIQTLFLNVATAIKGINLVPLLDGFTRLAGNQAALGALVSVINQVGTALQSIANNTSLNEAFKGLGEVTNSLLQGLTALVNNGITLFANAWPGMKAGLDGITAFFNKFDWASLGQSVGGVFKGLGEALKSIPQGTIDGIARGFQDLSTAVSNPQFAGAIQTIAGMLPGILSNLGALITGTSSWVTRIAGIVDLVNAMKNNIQTTDDIGKEGLFGSPETHQKMADAIKQIYTGIPPDVAASMNQIPPIVSGSGQAAAGAAQSTFGPIPGVIGTTLSGAPTAATGALGPIVPGINGILTQIPPAVQAQLGLVPGAVTQGMSGAAPAAGTEAAKVPPAVTAGLKPLDPAVQAALGQLDPAFVTAFQGLAQSTTTGMGGIAQAVSAGVLGVGTALLAGFNGLNPSITTAFQGFAQTATTGVGLIGIGIQAGMPGVQAVLSTAFTALSTTAILPAFQAMALQATTGIGLIGIAVQAGMPGLTTVLLTAFTSLGPLAVLPAFTAIATTIIPQAMAAMGVAVTTGITTFLVPAFTTGLAAITTTVTTWTATLPPLFATAFATINTSVVTAFTLMNATIVAQLAIITLTFTNWTLATGLLFTTMWANLNLGVITAFTLLNTTILAQLAIITLTFTTWIAATQLLFTTMWMTLNLGTVTAFTLLNTTILAQTAIITTTITTWIASINTLFTGMWTAIQESTTTAWAAIVQAVTDGAAAVLQAITDMSTAVLDTLQQLIDAMTTVGDNITTALANAITAGQSKVVNAIVAMVAAALAAAFGALGINSPSKEFQFIGSSIPEGTAKGIDDNKAMVVKSVESMANAAIDAGSNIFIPGPTVGGAQMAATTAAATANALESAKAGSDIGLGAVRGGTVINIKALPSATAVQLANEVVYKTTFSRQGVHSGR